MTFTEDTSAENLSVLATKNLTCATEHVEKPETGSGNQYGQNLNGGDGQRCVLRTKGSGFGGGSIRIWGCVTANGAENPSQAERRMDQDHSHKYWKQTSLLEII